VVVKLSVKFSTAVILIVIASLAATAAVVIRQQNQAIHAQVRVRAENVLLFGQSCRQYTRETLSPALDRVMERTKEKKTPFIKEPDAATFVVRGTFHVFSAQAKEYSFREAALNPLNPANRADADEQQVIEFFRTNREQTQKEGYLQRHGSEVFYV